MPQNYKNRIFVHLPLFLGGIFLVYLAVLDESLFDFIISNTAQNEFSVALATTIAAGLPMFFAVGFIKKTILRHWQTIYYYEKFLASEIFWILAIIVLNIFTFIIVSEEGVHQFNAPILAGCVSFSVYLVFYSYKIRKKNYRVLH